MASLNPSNKCESNDRKTHSSQSPIVHLLRGNHPPTEAEATLTRNVIKSIEIDIIAVDEDISKARLVVKNLLSKREAMQANADSHAGIVSTLRKIPSEILSYIFELCLPDGWIDPSSPISSSVAPLLIEKVCRRWRDIARITPELHREIRETLTMAYKAR